MPAAAGCGSEGRDPAAPLPRPPGLGAADAEVYASYAGSESCRECHPTAFGEWSDSHHALAERDLDPELDRAAFDPPHRIAHGSQLSEARVAEGVCELWTEGPGGEPAAFPVARVFGVFPLQQFVIPAGGGREQVSELAWDPAAEEWFNVYGDDDRRAGEWGHWTGRGMTWNSMCAACHNTRVRKQYDPDSDTYRTTRAEMGVGCEACHGPARAHVLWQKGEGRRPGERVDPYRPPVGRELLMDTCGSCHARRSDLTGDFVPGERFLDHYLPVIPDATDVYYPDGQVRDEDFEYVSFLGSRMHAEGVTCLDCHSPHAAKPRARGNELCLRCHAPAIEPESHSRHEPGRPGGNCVDCHMPLTTYMQRHPRHDHGFTIPDPLLTIEHGIPNACNRCHVDREPAWALEATREWYGERMERGTRERARIIARARAGETGAVPGLLGLLAEEPAPLWRAVAAGLLGDQLLDPRVPPALRGGLADESALVRSRAAMALEPLAFAGEPETRSALEALLVDPVRAARVEAAWALRTNLDPGSRAGRDLTRFLRENLDHPLGSQRMGQYLFDRGSTQSAIAHMRRAVRLDGNSPELRHALALALSAAGRPREAADELEEACRRFPGNAELHFSRGLAWSEAGDPERATGALQAAVERDPGHFRAWYNLGLAYAGQGRDDEALGALATAESLDATSPEPPYAAATIHYKLGAIDEARLAALRALQRDPAHAGAARLVAQLPP